MLNPTLFDYIVAGVLVVSLLLGLIRGLLREVFGLGSWIVAIVLAKMFAASLAPLLPASWGTEPVRYAESLGLIVLGVKILLYGVSALLGEFIRVTGLKPLDRMLGAGFGLIRGVLLLIVAALICGMTQVPQQPFWKQAILSPYVVIAAQQVLPYLPENVSQKVVF